MSNPEEKPREEFFPDRFHDPFAPENRNYYVSPNDISTGHTHNYKRKALPSLDDYDGGRNPYE